MAELGTKRNQNLMVSQDAALACKKLGDHNAGAGGACQNAK